MKKTLALIIALVMLLAMAGCTSSNSDFTNKNSEATQAEEEFEKDTRDIKDRTKENINNISENIINTIKGYKIDYGTSEIYEQKDLDAAISIIDTELNNTGVCTINSISYCGDKESSNQLEYCQSFDETKNFVEAAVFISTFHTAKDTKDTAFNSDYDYEWTWYFAREAGGEWVCLTHGVD